MTDQQANKLLEALDRLNLLLGAVASNQQKMVQLKAKELNVPCLWWDPSKDGQGWPFDAQSGDVAELKVLLLGIPFDKRSKPPA